MEDVGLLESSSQAAQFVSIAARTQGLYLIPAFSGLGAPYWNSDARAMICGMNRETGKAELVRVAEECIAFQIADILLLMEKEIGKKVDLLRVDGGPTKDRYLMQFQSDIMQVKVRVPNIEELSASGPAFATLR